jgi:hypothetical protein
VPEGHHIRQLLPLDRERDVLDDDGGGDEILRGFTLVGGGFVLQGLLQGRVAIREAVCVTIWKSMKSARVVHVILVHLWHLAIGVCLWLGLRPVLHTTPKKNA